MATAMKNESLMGFFGILFGQIGSLKNISKEKYEQAVEKEQANFMQILQQRMGAKRELVAAAIIAMATVSLIGNGLVCCVIQRRRSLRTVTNIFLLNLSIAQMLLACTAVPINLVKMFYVDWQLGGAVCSLAYFANSLCTGASSFTLVSIAVDRHRVIVTPMRPRLTKSAVRWMLAGCWLASVAMAAASAAWPAESASPQGKAADPGGPRRVYITRSVSVCAFMSQERSGAVRLAFTCMAFALQYFLPLLVISLAYARIIHTLWIAKKSFGPGGHAGPDSWVSGVRHVARRRTVIMLVLVVCLFFVSWSPIHLYVISSSWREVQRGDHEVLLHGICFWIAMSNIWYNPVIYVWLNGKFRKALCQIVCSSPCLGSRGRRPQLEPSAAAAFAAAAAAATAVTPRRYPHRGRHSGEEFPLTDIPESNQGMTEQI